MLPENSRIPAWLWVIGIAPHVTVVLYSLCRLPGMPHLLIRAPFIWACRFVVLMCSDCNNNGSSHWCGGFSGSFNVVSAEDQRKCWHQLHSSLWPSKLPPPPSLALCVPLHSLSLFIGSISFSCISLAYCHSFMFLFFLSPVHHSLCLLCLSLSHFPLVSFSPHLFTVTASYFCFAYNNEPSILPSFLCLLYIAKMVRVAVFALIQNPRFIKLVGRW